jgi:hypothetical protein
LCQFIITAQAPFATIVVVNQYLENLARSLQILCALADGWSGPPSNKGKIIMSVRFESLSRVAFSLVAAVAFTFVLASTAVSLSPIA